MHQLTIAIQTVRSGSKSVPGKNEININGEPLYVLNLRAAKKTKNIDKVFLSSDVDSAPFFCKKLRCHHLPRPNELAGDDASHYETIKHALNEAEKILNCEVANIVVLLGNNRCAYPDVLSKAINMLSDENKLTSVISVGKYNMFNPLRAFKHNGVGSLQPVINATALSMNHELNDKNVLGDIYFFNGSFWVIRREAFVENKGFQPFPWLGSNIGFIEQDPQCMEIDDYWQKKIVINYGF